MFFFICARIKGWENNGEAGDLTHRRAFFDVIVMDLRGNGNTESASMFTYAL